MQELEDNIITCDLCNKRLDTESEDIEDQYKSINDVGFVLCMNCYNENYRYCNQCDHDYEIKELWINEKDKEYICKNEHIIGCD